MSTIFVVAGYKTASTTLQHTFKARKTHNVDFAKELPENINIILMPFRDNKVVYSSAYFQDIIVPTYEYSPFHKTQFLNKLTKVCSQHCGNCCDCKEEQKRKNIINTIPTNLLVKHYKTINWNKYEHLNNIIRINIINKTYGTTIDYNSKEYQVYNIIVNNKPRKLISFNIDILNSQFNKLKEILGIKENIQLHSSNISNQKWYKEKYREFINLI